MTRFQLNVLFLTSRRFWVRLHAMFVILSSFGCLWSRSLFVRPTWLLGASDSYSPIPHLCVYWPFAMKRSSLYTTRSVILTDGTFVSANTLKTSFLTEIFALGAPLIRLYFERHFRNLYKYNTSRLAPLQSVLDAAARLIARLHRFSHISTFMIEQLHWLNCSNSVENSFSYV
jgi:hypothetical protein